MKKALLLGLFMLLAGCSASAGRRGEHASAPKDTRYWLWCDGEANLELLNNDEGVSGIVSKAAASGITDLVVDVKLISGEVLYSSKIAPHVMEWNGKPLPGGNYDRLAAFVKEAHAKGLRVHASMNVFSEAHKFTKPPRGVLLSNPQWQTIIYTKDGLKPTLEINQGDGGYAGFVNMLLPEVQRYELSIIDEITKKYAIDGIVFDRMRYDNLYADFSDFSRHEFEKSINAAVERWPQDIFEYRTGAGGVAPGKYFNAWVQWRSANIRDFIVKARAAVKANNPNMEINAYTGSWYPLYYDVGVNWASDDFDPKYVWMTKDYHKTGFVKQLDHLMVGCYYPDVTIKELKAKKETYMDPLTGQQIPKDDWFSVQGACRMAEKAVDHARPVYGSVYVYDYFNDKKSDSEGFASAVNMCMKESSGVMLFDLVYIEKHNLWDLLSKTFKK